MLEHLLDPIYEDLSAIQPRKLIDAQVNTLNWLNQPIEEAGPNAKSLARSAFATAVNPSADPKAAAKNILALRAPEAVMHLVTMLDAYSWDFVQQAAEIRGYIVKELLEASQNPDSRVKLKALSMLGDVTEVGAFTQRSEVVHKQEPAGEVEERIRARLKAMLPPQQQTDDVEVKEIAVVRHEAKVA